MLLRFAQFCFQRQAFFGLWEYVPRVEDSNPQRGKPEMISLGAFKS